MDDDDIHDDDDVDNDANEDIDDDADNDFDDDVTKDGEEAETTAPGSDRSLGGTVPTEGGRPTRGRMLETNRPFEKEASRAQGVIGAYRHASNRVASGGGAAETAEDTTQG